MQTTKEKPTFLRTATLDEIKRKGRLTCISLFSGCGGFDVGTSQAGFETRVMVEWEEAACETLRANFTKAGHQASFDRQAADALKRGHKKIASQLRRNRSRMGDWYHEREPAILCADITKLTTVEILEAAGLQVGEADLLTGGFPCQGFSTAGQRRIEDERNVLYRECVRVVREALPRTFMLENVKGLISMDGGRIIRRICDDLANTGYDVRWKLLNAADYGVPQHRERVLFFGSRRDVLVDRGPKGRPALFMGHGRGEVVHDDFFEKKYPLRPHGDKLGKNRGNSDPPPFLKKRAK